MRRLPLVFSTRPLRPSWCLACPQLVTVPVADLARVLHGLKPNYPMPSAPHLRPRLLLHHLRGQAHRHRHQRSRHPPRLQLVPNQSRRRRVQTLSGTMIRSEVMPSVHAPPDLPRLPLRHRHHQNRIHSMPIPPQRSRLLQRLLQLLQCRRRSLTYLLQQRPHG